MNTSSFAKFLPASLKTTKVAVRGAVPIRVFCPLTRKPRALPTMLSFRFAGLPVSQVTLFVRTSTPEVARSSRSFASM